LPTHGIPADRLVREYRDERGEEIGRLVRLARRLGVHGRIVEDIIGDVIMYRLTPQEAEVKLRRLAEAKSKELETTNK